ncbi:hypothetical protein R9X47_11910 [Wukongibacter baidiensis]|uniref:hypothetical protein n=1 Tax=Wukongibacter baidiensis TaxID=1723361 RepID=UPI003D7FBDB8
MLQLIRFEIKKASLFRIISVLMVVNIALIWILYMAIGNVKITYKYLFQIIDSMMIILYCILSSVLYSKYVLDDIIGNKFYFYQRYPIKLNRIIWSKLLIVIFGALILSILSYIFVASGVILLKVVFIKTVYGFSKGWFYNKIIQIIILSCCYNLIGLLPALISAITKSKIMMLSISTILGIALNSIGENVFTSLINRTILLLVSMSIIQLIIVVYKIDKNLIE